jgi:hypothetical protein
MKTWLMTLPLVCAVGVAMADDMGKEGNGEEMKSAAAPGMAPAHYRMAHHRTKRLPSGDLRHCLDLQTNAAIIRCSETRRKR